MAAILILVNREIVKTSGFSVVLHQAIEKTLSPREIKSFVAVKPEIRLNF